MRVLTLLRHTLGVVLFLTLLLRGLHFDSAWAASLTGLSDNLSSTIAGETGVTHTITFTTATTDALKRVTFRFSTTQGGSTRPAGLDLSSTSIGSLTGLDNAWTLDNHLASSGIVYLTRSSTEAISSSTTITLALDGVVNSAIDDCQSSNDILQDTCHIHITTFSDDGSTSVDEGDTTYTVTEDPNLAFEVEDVPSGQTHNGVTSNVSSTSTSIAFGHLTSGVVRYATHKLTITTNAPHGYVVYVRVVTNATGIGYGSNEIDPFGATNATWTTPQIWSSPNGSSPNVDTGWLGANTSDTRSSGWSSGSGKFGPLSQNPHIVAISSGPERSGATIYVSYGIEVNPLQIADQYGATLVYDVQPIF